MSLILEFSLSNENISKTFFSTTTSYIHYIRLIRGSANHVMKFTYGTKRHCLMNLHEAQKALKAQMRKIFDEYI
jgi:hypothetical protein